MIQHIQCSIPSERAEDNLLDLIELLKNTEVNIKQVLLAQTTIDNTKSCIIEFALNDTEVPFEDVTMYRYTTAASSAILEFAKWSDKVGVRGSSLAICTASAIDSLIKYIDDDSKYVSLKEILKASNIKTYVGDFDGSKL